MGAKLAGAPREDLALLEEIGTNIGLAFQIQDDILDVTGTLQMLGKPAKSDEKNHKTTYVTIKGLEQAREDVEEISEKALEGLGRLSCQDEFLRSLVTWLIHREN